ncbi:hypothetical protein QUB47_33720 [Microcoleus sp. AT9_B5]
MLSASQSSSTQASACFPLVCRQQRRGKKTRLDRVPNFRRVGDRPPVEIHWRQQHWQSPQTSCDRIEFPNVQAGS